MNLQLIADMKEIFAKAEKCELSERNREREYELFTTQVNKLINQNFELKLKYDAKVVDIIKLEKRIDELEEIILEQNTPQDEIDMFYDFVHQAIALNKSNREKYADNYKFMSMPQFAHEFQTVHIDLGRRMGKTEFIKDNVSKDDIIIVPSNKFEARIKFEYPFCFTVDNVILHDNYHTNLNNIIKEIPYDATIWMDEIGYAKRDVTAIYQKFCCRDNNFTFVRFGK